MKQVIGLYRHLMRWQVVALLLISQVGLMACSGQQAKLSNLAKTDIDMVADVHVRQTEKLMRNLAYKLYRRNPRELHKRAGASIEQRVAEIFADDRRKTFAEIGHKRGVKAMLLAFDESYPGDRVFALMAGLVSMVRYAYGYNSEFYLFDSLNPQILYNSARNIEVLVWRLKTRQDAHGRPLLLTNSRPGEVENLSFERLFGKLISLQDVMAVIASQKWNRTINFIVQRAATATFLPVGL